MKKNIPLVNFYTAVRRDTAIAENCYRYRIVTCAVADARLNCADSAVFGKREPVGRARYVSTEATSPPRWYARYCAPDECVFESMRLPVLRRGRRCRTLINSASFPDPIGFPFCTVAGGVRAGSDYGALMSI